MFQIRIYDRMKVTLISNCVHYFETPSIPVRLLKVNILHISLGRNASMTELLNIQV